MSTIPLATDAAVHDAKLDGGLTAILSRRLTGKHDIDPWGLDPDVRALLQPLGVLRWRVDLDGVDLLPSGPALLVHNQRFGVSERFVLASGITRTLGRTTRPAGVADRALVGPTLNRIGVVSDDEADLRALFRRGELVSVGLERLAANRFTAGRCPDRPLAAALAIGVPVVPVAVVGRELARRWEIIVGAPIPTRQRGAQPTPTEVSINVRRRVGQLLEAARRGRSIL